MRTKHKHLTKTIAVLSGLVACTPALGDLADQNYTAYTLRKAGEPNLHLSRSMKREQCAASKGSILYVHGATFPTDLSLRFKLDGVSWADNLNDACFTVWGLDFAGYGKSGRYSDANRPPKADPIPGRVKETAQQIKRAIARIKRHDGVNSVSIIAHSWGTLAAGYFTEHHPEFVDRLVLFGPVGMRREPVISRALSATQQVTIEDQFLRFQRETPANHKPVLNIDHFNAWGQAYLASDPNSKAHTPAAVTVPNGPVADVLAAWSGSFPYNPKNIKASTLIVRGEWDNITIDEDALWLFNNLTGAPHKRDVKLSAGGHVMHLEQNRHALHAVTRNFLLETQNHD